MCVIAEIFRCRGDGLAGQRPALLQAGAIIKAAGAVEGALIFAVGINDADVRQGADIAIHASDIEMRARSVLRIPGRNILTGTAIVHAQNAERPWAELARKPRAILRQHDVVGVVQVDRSHEIAAVLDKERPDLRKVGRKALVWRSRIVDAHLAEIWVDRDIQDEAVAQNKLRVQSGIGLQDACLENRDCLDR